MTRERCNGCGRVLLHVGGELRCCNVNCSTGHRREHQLPLTPCRNDGCSARIDATHMPGGYCGECFRRLPPDIRRKASAEQHRRRAKAAVKS
jgi:hypothetical protein